MKRVVIVCVFTVLAGLGAYRIANTTGNHPIQQSAGVYFCPMHPGYTASQPGNCPICGMRLVERKYSDNTHLIIPASERERAGIATTRLFRRRLSQDVVAPGDLILDSPAILHSPVNGVIISVTVATVGPNPVPVKKDQLICVLRPSEDSKDPGTVEVRSPAPAWITLSGGVNSPVKKDSALVFYSSLEQLPVIAEVPLDGVDFVKQGSPADMTSDTDPGKVWHGSVTNVLGIYDPRARAVKVKLVFPNDSLNMRSNMPVHVKIHYYGSSVLAIPEDAVLWTGNRWICYLADSPDRFTARALQVGIHSNGFYQVRGGVKAGDMVVSKAAFLLDSEERLRPEIDR